MRYFLFLCCVALCGIACAAEQLFPNGDLKKTADFVPLSKQVAEKGFSAAAPWPSGIMIDTGSLCPVPCGTKPVRILV